MKKLYYKNHTMRGFEESVEVTKEKLQVIFKLLNQSFTFIDEIRAEDGFSVDFSEQKSPATLIEYINAEVGHVQSAMQDAPPGEKLVGIYGSRHSTSECRGQYVLCVQDRQTLQANYFDAGKFGNEMRFAAHAFTSLEDIEKNFDIDPKVAKEDIMLANLILICQPVQEKDSTIPFIPYLMTLDDQGIKKGDLLTHDYGQDFVDHYMEGAPVFFNKKTRLPFDPKLFSPKNYALKLISDPGYSTKDYIIFERSKLDAQCKTHYFCALAQLKDRIYFVPSSVLLDLQKRGKRAACIKNAIWLPKSKELDVTLLVLSDRMRTKNAQGQTMQMVVSPLAGQEELIPEELCLFLKQVMKVTNIPEASPKPQPDKKTLEENLASIAISHSSVPASSASAIPLTPSFEAKRSVLKGVASEPSKPVPPVSTVATRIDGESGQQVKQKKKKKKKKANAAT